MPNIHELGITIDDAAMTRLEETIALLQRGDPGLTVDDCINAIFLVGLVHMHSTLTLTYLRRMNTPQAEAIAGTTACAA